MHDHWVLLSANRPDDYPYREFDEQDSPSSR
jgi:hypothetical protein